VWSRGQRLHAERTSRKTSSPCKQVGEKIMSDVATLVRRYVERYNSNDVDGMLDCCSDDVVFETVQNPGGAMKLAGKDSVREVLEATTRAFRERRHELVRLIVDGERAAAETVFSGVAAAELSETVRPGDHVSIRGATIFELRGDRLARICDYS
jgi:steroid delta-isomerase-like uncharacterized protein